MQPSENKDIVSRETLGLHMVCEASQNIIDLGREVAERIKEHVLPDLSPVYLKRMEIEIRRGLVIASKKAEEDAIKKLDQLKTTIMGAFDDVCI